MSDLKMFKTTLEENKNSLNVIENILTASINLSTDNQTKLSLTDRIQRMQIADEILTNNKYLSNLEVYKHLMREHQRLIDVLNSDCLASWRKQIEWLENDTDGQNSSWRTMLRISGSQEDIGDSFFALKYFDTINFEIERFADKFINSMVKPIIVENLQVDITKTINVSTLTLKVSKNKDDLSKIIEVLKDVFKFLDLTLPVNINETQVMSYLGSYASQSFCDIFKNVALFNAIPVQYNQLHDFQKNFTKVFEFNTYLTEIGIKYYIYFYKYNICMYSFDCIGFFDESNDELVMYLENIDNLFFMKISQLYYDQARIIIKKDLHDLVEVNNVSKYFLSVIAFVKYDVFYLYLY